MNVSFLLRNKDRYANTKKAIYLCQKSNQMTP